MAHTLSEPQWVLVDGTLHALADFAHLPPSKRPAAICPVCREPVLLKLGKKRTHHYAHYAGATCATTNPETALHLNTKCYLGTQLRNATALRIAIPCQNRCGAWSRRPWLQDWDTVVIEYRMDSFRPDIALIRQGKVIGAIEVVVTHPVDEGKQAYFAQEAVEWIEVAGNAQLYDGSIPWRPNASLLIIEGRGSPPRWMCTRCRAKAEEAARYAIQKAQTAKWQEAAAARHRAAEQATYDNRQELHAWKVLDWYFPTGKKQRTVYYVVRQYEKNVLTWFALISAKGERIAYAGAANVDIALQALTRDFREYLRLLCQRQSIIIDHPTRWQRCIEGQSFVAPDTDQFPFRYGWDATQQAWVDEQSAQRRDRLRTIGHGKKKRR